MSLFVHCTTEISMRAFSPMVFIFCALMHPYVWRYQDLIITCNKMYTEMATGLAPEITFFNMDNKAGEDLIVKEQDSHNLLRPETVESLFVMHRLTGDKKYVVYCSNVMSCNSTM